MWRPDCEKYIGHMEEIELDLVDKSESMAIFESVLLYINNLILFGGKKVVAKRSL